MDVMTIENAPDFDKLEAFVGSWRVTGAAHDGRKDTPAVGNENFQWSDDHKHMTYTWDRHFKDVHHAGRGMIGYDDKTGTYYLKLHDNLGFERIYELKILEREIRLHGSLERARISIDENKRLHEHWETNRNGEWLPLCDLVGQPIRL